MKTFKPYNPGLGVFKKESKKSSILKALSNINIDFSNKKNMTKAVKLALVKLGHKLGYYVYARVYTDIEWAAGRADNKFSKELGIGMDKYKNKEWLYDIHWYTDIDPKHDNRLLNYMPKTFELACECEWSKNEAKSWNQNIKDIGYDFQKLLFSNAKLNLFICRCHTPNQLKDLQNYFYSAINNFENLSLKSRFLIACFKRNDLYFLSR